MIVIVKISAVLSVFSAIFYIAVFSNSPGFSKSVAIFLILFGFLLVILSNLLSALSIRRGSNAEEREN